MWWRDLRLLGAKIRRLREAIYETIPEEQVDTLERNLSHMSYHLGAERVANEPDYVYISLDDLHLLVKYAVGTECVFCAKDKGEARRCKLRKALDSWTTHDMAEVEGCAYREGTVSD